MKGKLINFRAFLVIAISVTAAVFCVYLYMYNTVAGLTVGIIYILLLAGVTVYFVFRFCRNVVRLTVVISFVLATALCVSAFTVGVVVGDKWHDGLSYEGYGTVSGRVCAVNVSAGTYRIDLDELHINGRALSGIMRVSVVAEDNNIADLVRCGDRLQFGATVRAVKITDGGKVNGTAYRTDIRYNTTVKSNGIIMSVGKPKPIESFLISLKSLLTENMGERYGNIAFAMLTGDKHDLNNGVFGYYSAAGLGHIMAVSGLHIGFFILLLNLIMRRLSKKVRYPIMACVLMAYVVLADFSPSIIRAVIMAIIAGIGILIGGRRDLLSSLCCAYSLLLAVKPLYMFEAGFLMSFGALFGIALFANSVKRFLVKHRANKKVASGIGGAVSASVGILPAQIYFFRSVNVLSVLINVFVIPYVSIVFIAILCILPVAAIPGCGQALIVCKYLLAFLDNLAYGLSKMPYAVIMLHSAWQVFLCYPIYFFGSEYIMLKKGKTAVGLYSAAVCIAIICVCSL